MAKKKEKTEAERDVYVVEPETPKIKALIYGEPGCGKTTLASQANDHKKMEPVLFANVEGGLLSVAHRRDINAIDIRKTQDLYDLYDRMSTGDLEGEVGTLVIDNFTEVQAMNLDEIVRKEVASGKNSNRVSNDDIWQDDYGVSTTQLARILRWFRNLPINLIITAHAKFVYPPTGRGQQVTDKEPVAVLPMLSQKLCKTAMGQVDFVWFLEYQPEHLDDEDNTVPERRLMLTRPDGIRQAKTRGPKFAEAMGPEVENPHLPTLYDIFLKSSK